jgi:hypothetical protein
MTRTRSTALAAGLLIALALAGCKVPASSEPDGPAWKTIGQEGLNCPDGPIEVDRVVKDHDFDGDHGIDYFVTRRCGVTVPGSPRGGQLEIFHGGTDPVRLGVIVRNWQGYKLNGCVDVVGGKAYTVVTKGTTRAVWMVQRTPNGVKVAPAGDQDREVSCS